MCGVYESLWSTTDCVGRRRVHDSKCVSVLGLRNWNVLGAEN